jgi:MFS family permease
LGAGEARASRIGKGIIGPAFRKLATTFRHAKKYKEFIKYMIAYLLYNDGIMMLMDFAAIIGATLFGMKQTQLILFVILIQASGSAGALLFGRISDKRSGKEAIILSLLILLASVSGLFFMINLYGFTSWDFLPVSLSPGRRREPHGGQPARPKDGHRGILRVSFRSRTHLNFYRTSGLRNHFVQGQQLVCQPWVWVCAGRALRASLVRRLNHSFPGGWYACPAFGKTCYL